jgi:hypothetical protein
MEVSFPAAPMKLIAYFGDERLAFTEPGAEAAT